MKTNENEVNVIISHIKQLESKAFSSLLNEFDKKIAEGKNAKSILRKMENAVETNCKLETEIASLQYSVAMYFIDRSIESHSDEYINNIITKVLMARKKALERLQ